jgi:hypothetical protein
LNRSSPPSAPVFVEQSGRDLTASSRTVANNVPMEAVIMEREERQTVRVRVRV